MNPNRELFGLFNTLSLSRFNFGNMFSRFNAKDGKLGLSGNFLDRINGGGKYQKPSLAFKKPTIPTLDINPELIKNPTGWLTPDISSKKAQSKPAVYTRPEVAQNPESGDESQLVPQDNIDQTGITSQERKWVNLVNLNMKFNLADFERIVTRLAQDAQDGALETTTTNKFSMGLHTDLNIIARVDQKITYENPEALDQSNLNKNIGYRVNEKNARQIQLQSRQFKAESFYHESLSKRFQLDKSFSDGYLRISRKMSMRYTQDSSFSFSSLQKYSQQTEALEKTGNAEQYLNTTEALVDNQDVSGALIGEFFGMVDNYMDQAEDKLLNKIDDFFNDLNSQVGIEAKYTDRTKELLVSSVKSFFDKVEMAVNGVESRHIAPATDVQGQVAPAANSAALQAEPFGVV